MIFQYGETGGTGNATGNRSAPQLLQPEINNHFRASPNNISSGSMDLRFYHYQRIGTAICLPKVKTTFLWIY